MTLNIVRNSLAYVTNLALSQDPTTGLYSYSYTPTLAGASYTFNFYVDGNLVPKIFNFRVINTRIDTTNSIST